jgi:hypothetical protein
MRKETYSSTDTILGGSAGSLLSEANDGDLLDLGAEAKVTVKDTALASFALGASGLENGGEGVLAISGDGSGNQELTIGMETDDGGVVQLGG